MLGIHATGVGVDEANQAGTTKRTCSRWNVDALLGQCSGMTPEGDPFGISLVASLPSVLRELADAAATDVYREDR